jgi:hypothetical protein
MIKFLAIIFISVILPGSQAIQKNIIALSHRDSPDSITISVYPQNQLIEVDTHAQYLNFDMVLKNTTQHVYQLSMIQVSVLNKRGELVQRKYLNQNGRAPSISLLGNTIIKPGQAINIFSPFYQFSRAVDISSLRYEFFFEIADNESEVKYNKTRLPMDFDITETKEIHPTLYIPKTNLYLPLKGKMIVWDGHDFYSHHRRFPIGLSKQGETQITANSNRYAYDFVSIDKKGNMYKNNPFQKENWYVFGKKVYAPGAGRVVESQNNIPDNIFNGKSVKYPDIPFELDSFGMGNHVIIDHGNGEYSVILHMQMGSVIVKTGDRLKAGQQIGNVGFSGDAIFPHVHYTVINGPKEQICEGLPSYFNDYKLFNGHWFILVQRGRVDSGFIIESSIN